MIANIFKLDFYYGISEDDIYEIIDNFLNDTWFKFMTQLRPPAVEIWCVTLVRHKMQWLSFGGDLDITQKLLDQY